MQRNKNNNENINNRNVFVTRGLSASRLKNNTLWWRGPDFLTKHESEWPKAKIKEGSEVKMEAKKKLTLTSSLNFVLPHRLQDRKWRLHPSNWSSWLRLTRVCAWVLRFVQNCRSSRQERLSESLSPEEIENAEILIILEAQQAAFTEEYLALQENKWISKKSRLRTLVPLLDEDGLIRCDGRLRFAEFLPYDMRFPIILPRGSWTTKLIVSDRGTNFIGADRELRKLLDGLDRDKIKDQTVSKVVKWFLNPPLAPHFGEVHEVMIKAAKKAIRAILGDADVNDEELMTTFTGVQALMNSRPLTYQSANPKDFTPLTPNHFLHGQACVR